VLLVLDDCWDAEVATHFKWIDPITTSKILISSRVRSALEGGEIIDVTVPSQEDAVKMLLSTAGMDIAARTEVAQIVELCKRLPLTIGVAGKLIKELTHGSTMTDASDWVDVVELLKTELDDPQHGDLSIEEHLIHASIKLIPKKIQKQVTRLFYGFALVPEDTHVTLPVLGVIFGAGSSTGDVDSSKKTSTAPSSRMHIRNYLKVLIDRSLVLGTVDRPQLHDVMLVYVKKELTDDQYKAAQRRLVDAFRGANRSPAFEIGQYMGLHIKYHIAESYDEVWGKSPQAMSWLEDHTNGVQDLVAFSTASILPDVQALAIEAEGMKLWWSAALRWNAFACMRSESETASGYEFLERTVQVSANIHIPTGDSAAGGGAVHHPCTQFELDSLNLNALALILMGTINTIETTTYGEQIEVLKATEAGKSRPVFLVRIEYFTDWMQSMVNGDIDKYFDWCWKLTKMGLDLNDERTDAYSRLTEDERQLVKPAPLSYLCFGGDAMMRTRDFQLKFFGPNGDKLVEWANAYTYAEHHTFLTDFTGMDGWLAFCGADWTLTQLYGRVADAIPIMKARLGVLEKVVAAPRSRAQPKEIVYATSTLLVCYHLHGQSQMTSKHFKVLGITFDSVSDYLSELTKKTSTFCSMDHTGIAVGNGFVSLKRFCWQFMAFFVMDTDMPASKAIAWLESLPNDEGFYQVAMTKSTHDVGALIGVHQTCWLALAHEKVGLYDGALRFCRLALEPDLKKAGSRYSKWTLTIALACKGRVLMKLNRHTEALDAFQAGIATSKESYPMMEALAYRELANCNAVGAVPAAMVEAARQAKRDLEEKLKGFNGRLTSAEFDMLTIAPA
jgi:hypothetical protein